MMAGNNTNKKDNNETNNFMGPPPPSLSHPMMGLSNGNNMTAAADFISSLPPLMGLNFNFGQQQFHDPLRRQQQQHQGQPKDQLQQVGHQPSQQDLLMAANFHAAVAASQQQQHQHPQGGEHGLLQPSTQLAQPQRAFSPLQPNPPQSFPEQPAGVVEVDSQRAKVTLSSFVSLLSSAKSTGDANNPSVSPQSEPALCQFFSPLVSLNDSDPSAHDVACFPALSLRNQSAPGGRTGGACAVPGATTAREGMTLRDSAALNLAMPFCVPNRQSVGEVPGLLLQNMTQSFESLLESRTRSTIMALLQQSLKLGSNGAGSRETSVLCRLLGSSTRPVILTTIVTTFRVLDQSEKSDAQEGTGGTIKGGAHTLPLIFEAVCDAKVLGKLVTVSLSVPGTIGGSFHPEDGLLHRIEVVFDTIALLRGMMNQARALIKKAVSRAARIACSLSGGGMRSQSRSTSLADLASLNSANVVISGTGNNASFCNGPFPFGALPPLYKEQRAQVSSESSGTYLSSPFSSDGHEAQQEQLSQHQEFLGSSGFPRHLQDIASKINAEAEEIVQKKAMDKSKPSSLPSEEAGAKPFHPRSEAGRKALAALGASINDKDNDCAKEGRNKKERVERMGSHELFSWLKGDDMFLKSDTDTVLKKEDSKSRQQQEEGHVASREQQQIEPPTRQNDKDDDGTPHVTHKNRKRKRKSRSSSPVATAKKLKKGDDNTAHDHIGEQQRQRKDTSSSSNVRYEFV